MQTDELLDNPILVAQRMEEIDQLSDELHARGRLMLGARNTTVVDADELEGVDTFEIHNMTVFEPVMETV